MNETLSLDALLAVPAGRREALAEAARILSGVRRVVLTTHVNADADGVGSEAALLAWLREQGAEVSVVNPTPLPDSLRWILPKGAEVLEPDSEAARAAIAAADRVVVLDTSERNRVEPLADLLDPATTMVIDHHPAGDAVVGEWALQDPSAAATGEMIFDLIRLAGGGWSAEVVRGIYVALVSDTGSFRYANTSARALAIAARMVALGAEPEPVYHRLFGSAPRRRLELLREALDTFDMEPDTGLSWMVVTREMVEAGGRRPRRLRRAHRARADAGGDRGGDPLHRHRGRRHQGLLPLERWGRRAAHRPALRGRGACEGGGRPGGGAARGGGGAGAGRRPRGDGGGPGGVTRVSAPRRPPPGRCSRRAPRCSRR
jgi:bifunctional oligoribonuclease and PAP phosphatase NrnA